MFSNKNKLILIPTFLFLISSSQFSFAFSDINPQDPNKQAFNYLQANNIIGGYPDGTFKPEQKINRAEVTKIAVLSANLPLTTTNNCFPDLDLSQWYVPYVCTAFSNNIVSGYPDGTFKPQQNINRVEAIKIISEALNLNQKNNSINSSKYADYSNNEWYSKYLNTFIDQNYLPFKLLVKGDTSVTRREFSEIFYRVLSSNKSTFIGFQDTQFSLTSNPNEVIQMLDLINQERTSRGLQPVEYSNELSYMAELHSQDMISRNFFSHVNPDGLDIDTRRKNLGITTFVGENISKNTSVLNSHNSLMNSPGHKANILDPTWNRLGLGIIKSGNIYYISQQFSLYPIDTKQELEQTLSTLDLNNLTRNSNLQTAADKWSKIMADNKSASTIINGQDLKDLPELQGLNYKAGTSVAFISTDLETIIKAQLNFTNQFSTQFGASLSKDSDGNFYFIVISF